MPYSFRESEPMRGASGRHDGQARKLKVHILNLKSKAERSNRKSARLSTLNSPARLHQLNLP